jgi:hypothetical protein
LVTRWTDTPKKQYKPEEIVQNFADAIRQIGVSEVALVMNDFTTKSSTHCEWQ